MKLFLGLTCGLAMVAGSAFAQNLLTNGNLDLVEPTEVATNFFLPKPQSWVYEGSRTISGAFADGLSSEGWAGPAPTPVTTDGGLNDPNSGYAGTPDWGVFYKQFQGNATDGALTASLYQDVAGTPGDEYTLTGWAGGEANYGSGAEFAVEFLDVTGGVIGGSVLDLVANGLLTDNGEAFNYKQYTVSAVAPAGTAWVRARSSMVDAMGTSGGQAFVVDDFVLTPEPASMLLLLPALALLRRR